MESISSFVYCPGSTISYKKIPKGGQKEREKLLIHWICQILKKQLLILEKALILFQNTLVVSQLVDEKT